jgi:hypothetical protein
MLLAPPPVVDAAVVGAGADSRTTAAPNDWFTALTTCCEKPPLPTSKTAARVVLVWKLRVSVSRSFACEASSPRAR